MLKSQVVFITGRFRSGTSMLWNLFNQQAKYCAFYEPLHPNLLAHIKHVKPKQDHLGVDDYWQNYGLATHLADFYKTQFGQSRLYLESNEKWDELKNYIDYLSNKTDELTPVLKFNRMDLRLGWLKNNYSNAKIIHIQRHAYPLWLSSRKHITTKSHQTDESYPDAYDLLQWCADLSHDFPMLQHVHNRHGYFRHYFIWKLSQLMAQSYADIVLNLEDDFFHSYNGIEKMAQLLNWDNDTIEQTKQLIQKPASLKNNNAKPEKIIQIEQDVNEMFKNTGLASFLPSSLLSSIKLNNQQTWDMYPYNTQVNVQELLDALRFQKDELTAVLDTQNDH